MINENNNFKKSDMNKIKNKILYGNKVTNNNNFEINVNKNKIKSEKKKKLEKINLNSNINNISNIRNISNNIIRERFSFKNKINNNSVNNINKGS